MLYVASSHTDAASALRAFVRVDEGEEALFDAWEAEVVSQLDTSPQPRVIRVEVMTDRRLLQAAAVVGVDLTFRWNEVVAVMLPSL